MYQEETNAHVTWDIDMVLVQRRVGASLHLGSLRTERIHSCVVLHLHSWGYHTNSDPYISGANHLWVRCMY